MTNGLADFVAQEELQHTEGFWWSPDGSLLAYQETDNSAVTLIHLLDPMHPESEPQASRFPRAGTQNPEVRLCLTATAGGAPTQVAWDRARYPYVARVVWSEHAPLTILVQSRDQMEAVLLAVDPASGATRVLVTERDDAWVNLDITVPHWLADGSAFLWSTERSRAWNLELRARDGALVRVLTSAEVNYEGIVGFDPAAGVAYVMGAAEDTSRHLWAVPLDGTPRRLTEERCVHTAVFAPNGSVRVHDFAGPVGVRSWTVETSDGHPLSPLTSVAERRELELNAEWTSVGQKNLPALVLRPHDFEAGQR